MVETTPKITLNRVSVVHGFLHVTESNPAHHLQVQPHSLLTATRGCGLEEFVKLQLNELHGLALYRYLVILNCTALLHVRKKSQGQRSLQPNNSF